MQKPLLIVIPIAALAIIIGGYFLLGSGKTPTESPSDFDAIVNPPSPPSTPYATSDSSLLSPTASTSLTPAPLPTVGTSLQSTTPPSGAGSSTIAPSSTTDASGLGTTENPSSNFGGNAGGNMGGNIVGIGGIGGVGGIGGGEALTPATPIPSTTSTHAKTYKIQPGDTLATIAAKFLGSSAKWEELAKANPGVNPYNLKIGQVINLPSSSLIPAHREHGYDTAGPMSEDPPPLSPLSPPSSTTTLSTGAKTYLVKEGDTLWAIAQNHYADGSKWSLILKANRRQLSDASKLKPGMKLVIPASSANSDAAQ